MTREDIQPPFPCQMILPGGVPRGGGHIPYRTALEALTKVHDLGEDGNTLLDWLDTEIANAER